MLFAQSQASKMHFKNQHALVVRDKVMSPKSKCLRSVEGLTHCAERRKSQPPGEMPRRGFVNRRLPGPLETDSIIQMTSGPSTASAIREQPIEGSLMTNTCDAIIIGTGQAGPFLAQRLAGAGMKVAIIERKLFGGTCVNTGCIPTKTMVASAYAAHMVRRAADFGVVSNRRRRGDSLDP